MVLPRGKLSLIDATEIKQRIWDGQKQRDIADDFGITQATVSHINRGYAWEEAPWPNGDTGHLPETQWRKLKRPPNTRHIKPGRNDDLVSEVARLVREKAMLGTVVRPWEEMEADAEPFTPEELAEMKKSKSSWDDEIVEEE